MSARADRPTVDRDRILEWLWSWFAQRDVAVGARDNPEVLYLERGWIDSMGLMELIAALERTYEIRFDERHFQDPRFMTLQGLAELIAELSHRDGWR